MTRVYNFSAGPATLPLSILETAQRELVCYRDWGMSVLEISHRDERFVALLEETQTALCRLLGIPEQYDVLFLQGGSRLQFTMVPQNLLTAGPAEYILTGSWGKNARSEAERIGETKVVWDGGDDHYRRVPDLAADSFSPDASYVHLTSNETIEGVQFRQFPATPTPLVCDASSDFLSRPMPIGQFGLIYACAQKNAGPAGVTLVVIHRDLLERSRDELPGYLNYRNHAKANSLWNTPPTFAIYMVGLVAKWLEEEIGGLTAMEELNRRKSSMLYEVIDDSNGFYRGHAERECRSQMNVTFRLPEPELEGRFLQGASERGLVGLKGHRSVGGIRASVYNAMTIEGVSLLAEWMRTFARQH